MQPAPPDDDGSDEGGGTWGLSKLGAGFPDGLS